MMIGARRLTGVIAMLAICAGCGGTSVPSSATTSVPLGAGARRGHSAGPIKHIVLMVQENRSFNDFFATFPGADGTTTGQAEANPYCSPAIQAGPIALTEMPLILPVDMDHSYKAGYSVAYDGGKMDGFDLIRFDAVGASECTYPYQYTDPSQIKPYWDLATQYALLEHMFTTTASDSFTAHQDLIRGGTIVQPGAAMIDDPTCAKCFWGCDAPPGAIEHLITQYNQYVQKGPFPCSTDFQSAYPTLRDLLDAKRISWKYYVPPSRGSDESIYGKLWSAFDVVYAVRHSAEWRNKISSPETNILTDIQKGRLAHMSWVIPEGANSDHPHTKGDGTQYADNGPEWVATVVNAIGESPYWDSTAIVIVWDDWGGMYDNESAVLGEYGGPGERVPALVVSPYARAGYISTTPYQFGSIIRYIEQTWHLGSLHTTDETSQSILNSFNYHQTPIAFRPIASTLGPRYFLREKHSYKPPDTDW